jgi:putative transposase
MQYDPNIHKRRSIRFRDYDYAQAALYFITNCTKNKKCLFGQINDDHMLLNDAGEAAAHCWMSIPAHFPKALLHEFVVMPNHIHGIIQVTRCESEDVGRSNEFQKIIPGSIGSIVKGFKIGVTNWFRNNGSEQQTWQRNFYEHIIRSEESYHKIVTYIFNNPQNWSTDTFCSG